MSVLDYYQQEAIFMLSGYIVLGLNKLNSQKNSNEDIVDQLNRMVE
jgi:hypothetical protein